MEHRIRVNACNTVVVGTGAAGFATAERLHALGQTDVAIVTEGVNAGTSRNTGSDKQTYYKLTLSGGEPDSVLDMAKTLFDGECVDGDTALCEAALSTQGFLHLVELGVPFPRNRYGEYVGYKTDHDPRRRATSVGPYTSREMTRSLERAVREKGIEIFDRLQVVRVLSDGSAVCGLLCLDLEHQDDPAMRFVAFRCRNVVLATGGPAGMYENSVYPTGHHGATGVAFRAGAMGRNLTEWQYGLASLKPRWNVSGTYMQALPRFISTKADGSDEREFLADFFKSAGEMLTCVFLKGYQWPFDVRKVEGGSSIIDILVYLESAKGRRVFLDYRDNPGEAPVDFSGLSAEAREYLERAGACFGTPLERLEHMNAPAVAFYRERGVDLARQPLEIALCAQHNNGGLAIDCWWRTNVRGLYAVGEVAASHGVYRPGGSALNAGQVGAIRAAQHIAAKGAGEADAALFDALLPKALAEVESICESVLPRGNEGDTLGDELGRVRARMSRIGSAIRNGEELAPALAEVRRECAAFPAGLRVPSAKALHRAFLLEDALTSQLVYLSAMMDYVARGGKSRGSALYTDMRGQKPYESLPEAFTFSLDGGAGAGVIQEAVLDGAEVRFSWRPVRPVPEDDDFFENVWRAFREDGGVR